MLDWNYLVDKYDFAHRITGVVHCGAHEVEERDAYSALDIPVWWIEANPQLIPEIEARLVDYPKQQIIQALLADKAGQDMTFHISGPGYRGSSSVLEWGTHRTFSPLDWVDHVKLTSTTLNDLWLAHNGFPGANMAVTDLQGLDGAVLSAAGCLLEQCQYVYMECNRAQVYQGCMEIDEVDRMLGDVDPGPGFRRVETHWVGDQDWGDCLFEREGQHW